MLDDLCTYISVQSRITLTDSYFGMKMSGIVLSIALLDGKGFRMLSSRCKSDNHVVKYFDTVALEILNLSAIS
jgi:hypothetical protein